MTPKLIFTHTFSWSHCVERGLSTRNMSCPNNSSFERCTTLAIRRHFVTPSDYEVMRFVPFSLTFHATVCGVCVQFVWPPGLCHRTQPWVRQTFLSCVLCALLWIDIARATKYCCAHETSPLVSTSHHTHITNRWQEANILHLFHVHIKTSSSTGGFRNN